MKFNEERTFGVELEFKAPGWVKDADGNIVIHAGRTNYDRPYYGEIARVLTEAGYPCEIGGYSGDLPVWKITGDGSLNANWPRQCGELVSPPLKGFEGKEELKAVLKLVKDRFGFTTDISTGLHVHQFASDLTVKQLGNVVELYREHEGAIDRLVSVSRRNSHWARTMRHSYTRSSTFDHAVRSGVGDELVTPESVLDMAGNTGLNSRYHKVNILAYRSHPTVEFRQHQGTMNFNKIWAWVVFTQIIVETAKARNLKAKEGRVKYPYNTGNALHDAFLSNMDALKRETKMHKAKYRDDETHWSLEYLKARAITLNRDEFTARRYTYSTRERREELAGIVGGNTLR